MLIDPFYTTFRISLSHYIQIDVRKICINHAFPLLPKITKYIKLFSFVWNIPVLEKLWLMGGHYGSQMYRCGHATALRMIIFF